MKKGWKSISPPKWTENEQSVPDSNKTKINYTKEPNEVHKNTLKE
jgi:hypothetical protein